MTQAPLTFSITSGPPSADQLAAEQRRIDAELAAIKAKKIRATVVLCVLVALAGLAGIYNGKLACAGILCIASGGFMFVSGADNVLDLIPTSMMALVVALAVQSTPGVPVSEITVVVAILVAAVVATAAWVSSSWVHRNISDPLAALEVDQDHLELLPQANCPAVLELCQQHAAIAAYQARVASEPRLLVRGDAQAMDDWMAGTSFHLKEAAQQAACQALREPFGAPTLA